VLLRTLFEESKPHKSDRRKSYESMFEDFENRYREKCKKMGLEEESYFGNMYVMIQSFIQNWRTERGFYEWLDEYWEEVENKMEEEHNPTQPIRR